MIYIKIHPDLAKNSDPLINPDLMMQAEAVAASMDTFIRQAIAKKYSDSSLNLFLEMRESLPYVDLEVTFLSASTRRLKVFFKGEALGSALSETTVKISKGKIALIHQVKIERL